ncbi:histidine phosphotransferase family protein [Leisingera sp. JC1]|uniref:histidine phosphotransferase family protein n=1 Tax=Leisingera sp. JC1 TaxID=1855282 RepID=UPI000803BB34|nr:histidine phosphotransferase family protein [Leisingera sp. JC1]OBY27246.1 histidine phosphotransferase [Leisingera sp. JC1]
MGVDNANLAALVGSRICHDLISPVGAINNGLELLGMAGSMSGPELELISDSVANANARIRFFRIAFGAAGDQQTPRAEIVSVLEDVSKGGRIQYQWSPLEGCTRSEARLALLSALCLESALPYGGTVKIFCADGKWTIVGEGRKVTVDDELWARVSGGSSNAEITPALVQFALLPEAAKEAGRTVRLELNLENITMQF